MAPLTTGTPLVTAHAIHAKADTHASKKKAAAHAAPKKSTSPRLHPRRNTTVAKKTVRTTSPYRVRPGDNLTAIAARHGVSLTALIKVNHLPDPNRVLSGSILRIPHASAAPHDAPKTAKKTKTAKKAKATQHHKAARAPEQHKAAASSRAHSAPSRTQAKALIERTAKRYGVNPKLALGISWQESGWNQRVVSPVNAIGIMQVLPQSGEWASMLVGKHLDLHDAEDNVTAGVVILRYLTGNAEDLNQAIGAYYQGLGSMRHHGPFAETSHYVRNVRALMERL